MNIEEIKFYLEIAVGCFILLGIPTGIIVYLNQKNKDRREREYDSFKVLNNRYEEFLKLCLNNPDLDIYHMNGSGISQFSSDQKTRQLILFEILISILERAFLTFRDRKTPLKKRFWAGWNFYMVEWMRRENFRKAWDNLGNQWDTRFEMHMNKIYEKIKSQDRINRAGLR